MKKIGMYLDEAINQGIAKNSADLAKQLGVSRSALSEWRAGRNSPNDEQAVRLAGLLGKEAGELLAECGAARAKTPETRQAWERIAARMASGITLCLMLMPFGHSPEARASTQSGTYCFQNKRRPRPYWISCLKFAI